MGKISRVELARAAGGQVVDATAVDAPLVLDSIELLREVKNHFVRVTSGDLAGFAIAKPQICNAYTFFEWAAEFFVGKDARQIDALADGAGAHGRNYKYAQGASIMERTNFRGNAHE